MQSTQTASLDSHQCPCICLFDCCCIQQFLYTTPLAKLTRNPEKILFNYCVASCDLVESIWSFSVRLTVSETFKRFWDCPGVVSTTCCHCDIIGCIHDIILCDSSFELSALHPFVFMMSSSVTHSSNHLTIIHSHSCHHHCAINSFSTSVPHPFPLRNFL